MSPDLKPPPGDRQRWLRTPPVLPGDGVWRLTGLRQDDAGRRPDRRRLGLQGSGHGDRLGRLAGASAETDH